MQKSCQLKCLFKINRIHLCCIQVHRYGTLRPQLKLQEQRFLLDNKRKNEHKITHNNIQGSNEFKKIRKDIWGIKDAGVILKMVEGNGFDGDSSVYTVAMEKCNHLGAYDVTEKIIKVLMQNRRELLNNVVFNALFVGLGKLRNIGKLERYFRIMIDMGIKPDIANFGALMNACAYRVNRNSVEFAEYLIDILQNEYGLELDNALVVPMMKIYRKQNNMDKVHDLVNNQLMKSDIKSLVEMEALLGAYLGIISGKCDISSVRYIIELMKDKGITLNVVHYSNLMNAYFCNGDYYECINVFNDMINNGIKPDEICICHLLTTYLSIQHKSMINKDINTELLYHQKIVTGLSNLIKRYKVKEYHRMHIKRLDSMILYYRNRNPSIMVEYFQNNSDKYPYRNGNKIDLHEYTHISAQFILRYLFHYDFHDIIQNNQDLIIIVGKSIASTSLKQFVIKEINSWNSALVPINDNQNEGRVIIPNQSLRITNVSPTVTYFENNSHSWYMHV